MEKLHNEELHRVYYSSNIIKVIKSSRIRWVRHVACMEEMRNSYKILARESEEKRPRRRPWCGMGGEY
jgi:hypothetical protein